MTHDNLPPEPFCFVGAPTERRSINMNTSTLRLALYVLGAAFLICVVGIIYLSTIEPARTIPDVLQNVTIGILGLFGGIMVPTSRASLTERGEHGRIDAVTALVIVFLVLAIIFIATAVF